MTEMLITNSHREVTEDCGSTSYIVQKMIPCGLRDAGEDKMTLLIW